MRLRCFLNERYRCFCKLSNFPSLSAFIPCPANMSTAKPPNVLVYTGDEPEDTFKNIAVSLLRLLHPDKYVVYPLKCKQVLSEPWKNNTILLVVASNVVDENIRKCFEDYLDNNGKMMVVCSNINLSKFKLSSKLSSEERIVSVDEKDVNVPCGKYSYILENSTALVCDKFNQPLVQFVDNKSMLLVSELDLFSQFENDKAKEFLKLSLGKILDAVFHMEVYTLSIPQPSAGYIISKDPEVIATLKEKFQIKTVSLIKNMSVEESKLAVPLLFENETPNSMLFNKNAYFACLKTQDFGKVVLYFPIVTSTMIPVEHLSDWEGLVVTASRQTSGYGRDCNTWLSPEGCCMFSYHLKLLLSSVLGQRLSVLQHIASLAVIVGIKKIAGYENLDLRLKWPNDLYLGNKQKIGGVLVNTTIQGNEVHAYIGIGVNVDNYYPTTCINSAIKKLNEQMGLSLLLLKVEEVIAVTLTEFEDIVNNFEQFGSKEFLNSYYKHWLHEKQQVTLASSNEKAVIQGLDDYGFLVAQANDGKLLYLQPDGNRFDMLENLIISK